MLAKLQKPSGKKKGNFSTQSSMRTLIWPADTTNKYHPSNFVQHWSSIFLSLNSYTWCSRGKGVWIIINNLMHQATIITWIWFNLCHSHVFTYKWLRCHPLWYGMVWYDIISRDNVWSLGNNTSDGSPFKNIKVILGEVIYQVNHRKSFINYSRLIPFSPHCKSVIVSGCS